MGNKVYTTDDLKYDVAIEIPENKVSILKSECSGIIAGPNLFDGKWYIKLWMPKYKQFVLSILNK